MSNSNVSKKQKNQECPVFEVKQLNMSEAQEVAKALKLFSFGAESVNGLAKLYLKITKPGAPAHTDQDLLRAMLVMAGATLDSSLKRLIRDSLQILVRKNPRTKIEAVKRISREIKTASIESGESKNKSSPSDLIAKALLSEKPSDILVDHLIEKATGQSLQSTEEVKQVLNLFGLSTTLKNEEKLNEAFKVRNMIVHEMDAAKPNKGTTGWTKTRRKKDEMFNWSKVLLELSFDMIQTINDIASDGKKPRTRNRK